MSGRPAGMQIVDFKQRAKRCQTEQWFKAGDEVLLDRAASFWEKKKICPKAQCSVLRWDGERGEYIDGLIKTAASFRKQLQTTAPTHLGSVKPLYGFVLREKISTILEFFSCLHICAHVYDVALCGNTVVSMWLFFSDCLTNPVLELCSKCGVWT